MVREMNKFIPVFAMCLMSMPAIAAVRSEMGAGRRAVNGPVMAAPRATASTNQLSAMASMSVSNSGNTTTSVSTDKSSIRVEQVESTAPTVDMREKEKAACINNNIGIGNTFVWASRYSNTNNYAAMREDTENPENNTCFVKVELKSTDNKVSVSDVPSQYYEMGRDITCGAWADEGKIKQRILDAKKSGRTWGTVAGVVGGAGVGVGAMELFGNKLIGGKVQGQKALDDNELLRSQLLVLKKESTSEFNEFMRNLKELRDACDKTDWGTAGKPDECDEIDYDYLLGLKF